MASTPLDTAATLGAVGARPAGRATARAVDARAVCATAARAALAHLARRAAIPRVALARRSIVVDGPRRQAMAALRARR